ncbi:MULTISPECIES: phage tail protein [Nonomuraea]|uniref:phage tail protein n=1 Tax=Nonomuraea TaxID=83681 RepID=UPI0012F8CF0D|nr:phage tail protein [Nonomuraea typhae]
MADTERLKQDPLRSFKFIVNIGSESSKLGFANAGFMSVSGLNITTEVIPYREGGWNTTTRKMPGQSDFSPITLSNGLCVGEPYMLNWMQTIFTVVQGGGGGTLGDFRMDLTINVLDHPTPGAWGEKGKVKAAFKVLNAWPTSVAFSDLDAGANSIIIQQLTLAHEGFEMKLAKDAGASEVKF